MNVTLVVRPVAIGINDRWRFFSFSVYFIRCEPTVGEEITTLGR